MEQTDPAPPVFIVGAPRSGTSILTWCLGQHPNILPMEESNWMGDFAANAAAAHAVGSQRGERSQLSACGVSLDEFLARLGDSINALLLGRRGALLENAERAALANPELVNDAFKLARDAAEPKGRWVDGTPEYALHLPALRKLFPGARFIHIVREPGAVVKSMLKFPGEYELARSEQDAYEYWLRTVRACLAAERAWGSRVVHRLRYADLEENPGIAFERMFGFLSEPFAAACLEPLQVRINSSAVPSDFDPRDPSTDANLRAEAERLADDLRQQAGVELAGDPAAAEQLEAAFAERAQYFRALDGEYLRLLDVVAARNRELKERGDWGLRLDREIAARNARIVELLKQVDALQARLPPDN